MCKNNCKICDRLVISTSVTVASVGGVDTVLIDIPAASYNDCQRLCLVIAQTIPDTAPINAPVAITIGGDTTTVYPLVRCDCSQATACAIRTRTRYPLRVSTNATAACSRPCVVFPAVPTTAFRPFPRLWLPPPHPERR